MTYRLLEAEEFDRLRQTGGYPKELPLPDGDSACVMVAEQGDEIVGFYVAKGVVLMDGIWVKDSHQRKLVGPRLWASMVGELKTRGVGAVMTGADRQEIADYLCRLGYSEMPGQFFWRAI